MPSNQFFIACIILVLALKCSVYNEILESICYCTYPPAFNSPVNCTISGNMVTVPKFSSTTVSESEFFTVIKVRLWGKRSTDVSFFYWTLLTLQPKKCRVNGLQTIEFFPWMNSSYIDAKQWRNASAGNFIF